MRRVGPGGSSISFQYRLVWLAIEMGTPHSGSWMADWAKIPV